MKAYAVQAIVWPPVIVFIIAICCLGWVSYPLSPPIAGIRFPLFMHFSSSQAPVFISYGGLSGILLLLAGVAFCRGNYRNIRLTAIALLFLVVSAPLQVAFVDPELLDRLTREADWQQRAIEFSSKFLPANLGSEVIIWSTLPLRTVADRSVAGWYFMGLGWYAALLIALLLLITGLQGVSLRSSLRFALLTAVLMLLACGVLLARPLLAQYASVEGTRAEAQGDLNTARYYYLRTKQYDEWNSFQIDFHERLGFVDLTLGRTDSSDARMYLAERMVHQDRTLEAITEYQQLAASKNEVAPVARTRLADLWTGLGVQLYETGAFGQAVNAWRQALKYEPSNHLAAFCLTRGYFAIGMYHEAANLADELSNISDPTFRANAYCNRGDALSREDSLAAAHILYKRAYDLDYVFNRRALRSTMGQ